MWNLVGDVGGTNMRLAAVSSAGAIERHATYATGDDVTVPEACKRFITTQDNGPPDHIVIAAAGIVQDGAVKLTNADQSFSEHELAALGHGVRVRILNDFEAAAWSLATVEQHDVEVLQGTLNDVRAPRLIIGPGTGLGVGALVWAKDQPQVISGEGGHVALGPRSVQEVPFFERLVQSHPEFQFGTTLTVEAEAILSGTGIPLFYDAVARSMRHTAGLTCPQDIFQAAEAGVDPAAVTVARLFRDYLGGLAGDLGLAFGARGGVFVTGGVAQSNRWLFDQTFLDAFNAGGRYEKWRAQLPLCLYQDRNFGLKGARNYITSNFSTTA